uniref:L-lysine-epsilon aminotransferase n=1 Tax=Lygus hesperus TaxID=30085 RepID=A0A0A9Z0P3_LYGHE
MGHCKIQGDSITTVGTVDTGVREALARCMHILSPSVVEGTKDHEMLFLYTVQKIVSTISTYLPKILKEPAYYRQIMIRVYNSKTNAVLYGETPSSLYATVVKQLHGDDTARRPHRTS